MKELTDAEVADWLSGRSVFCPVCGNAYDGSYLCGRLMLDDDVARSDEVDE